jgi:uncharacterized protein HemX
LLTEKEIEVSEQAKGGVAKYLMSVATLAVIIIVGLVIVKSFAIQDQNKTEIAKTNTTVNTTKTNANSSDKTKKTATKTTSTNAKNIKNIAPAAAPTTTTAATTANSSTTTVASTVTATGPRETLMTLVASAALTFAGVSYFRSRQVLRQHRS